MAYSNISFLDGLEKHGNNDIFVYHAEGRAAYYFPGTSAQAPPPEWQYEYSLRDHLGNSRVMIADKNNDGYIQLTGTDWSGATYEGPEIIQENHYYPFGLNMEGSWRMPAEAERVNKYQYNGKELNGDLGLGWNDYGARWYAPDAPRFLSIDPLSSEFEAWSPYSYAFNNPIRYIDPDGRAADNVIISGPEADRATKELDNSSNLKITRNATTGELSATGKARNKADKKLLAAINDKNITVELQTTTNGTYNSSDGTTNIPLTPGGYEGSTVDPATGHVNALQLINMDAADNIAKVNGEQTGETVKHEINEAYIGAIQDPGGNYSSGYQNAHKSAASLDRVQSNLEFNLDPSRRMMQARKVGTTKWTDIIKI